MRTYKNIKYNTIFIITIIIIIMVISIIISITITIIIIIMWGRKKKEYLHQRGKNKSNTAAYKHYLRNENNTIK